MKENTKYLINLTFTIGIIAIILYFVDINEIANTISKIDPIPMLLAGGAYIILNILMSERIKVMLSGLGADIKLKSALKANFGGMLASDFTPARSGYFLTAFLLSSEHKIELDKTMLAIFGPQLIEFAIKVICSSLLVLLIMNQFSIFNGQEWIVTLSLFMITGVIGFFLALLFHPTLLNRFSFIKKLGPAKKVFFLFQLMRDNSNVMLKKLPIILLLTLGSWFTKGVEWFLIAKAFGIVVMDPWLDIGFFLLFHPFITFIHFLPLPTLAGTGTGEAAASGILALFGIPLGVGITFGFLTRTMMIFVDLIGLFAIIPLIKKESIGSMLNEMDDIEKRIE